MILTVVIFHLGHVQLTNWQICFVW